MKLLLTLAIVALIGSAIARPARDAKSDLIAKANDLVKKADDAVTKLTADKKDHEATIIKTQEAHIKKLIEDLTAATADAQVRRLEMELTQADNRLTHEIARVNQPGTGPARTTQAPANVEARDLKSDLTTKGNDLVTKIDEAITKLTADKKDHEVTILKTQETHLKKLIEDLTAATDDAKVRTLERELGAVEARLTHELTRINQIGTGPSRTTQAPASVEARDLKSDLTTKGNDLVTKIDEAITKLTADKKDHEVTMLKNQETQLKKLIEDLTAATDDAKVRQLEHQLTGLEARLAHELTRIDQIKPLTNPSNPTNPVTRDAKSDLIAKANDLVKKADDAVTKLTADKKDHEATIIKTQEAHIKKLIEDLTAATADAQVRRLEMELTQADNRLTHEIARVNQPGTGPTRTTQATLTNE